MTRDFDFDRFDIRSVAFCSRHNEGIDITGEEKLLSTFQEPGMVDKDRGASHLSNIIFYDHGEDDDVTTSSPQIVENVAPVCRGGERVVGIRLPRHLTVELSDIFVLDICVRRKVHGYYTSALG